MPSVDYSKIVMYKIVCKNPDILGTYIGSTACFNTRKSHHKYNCNTDDDNKKYNYKIYKFIRENGGWDNFEMIQIEPYPCKNKTECLTRERELIELELESLNSNKPIISVLESIDYSKNYYYTHLEQLKDYQKDYRKKNHDDIIKWKNIRCICDCGSSYSNVNKATHFKTQRHKNWLNSFNLIKNQ